MAYVVTMTYKDEKAVNIKIKEEEIEKFFNDMNASQVYLQPDTQHGFWTNIADIRYITTVKEGESDVKVAKHAHESTAKLPGEEDRPEGSEEGASEG